MNRFFTADWHLFSDMVRQLGERPYSDVEKMNIAFIRDANQRTHCTYKNTETTDIYGQKTIIKTPVGQDVIYHVGDFFKKEAANKLKPEDILTLINARMILLSGNHDANNRVKAVADCITIDLGIYKNVTISHFPSYADESKCLHLPPHSIHICGHVHKLFKWAYDKYNDILNVNVGMDVWNYHIVSEQELTAYITFALQRLPNTFIGKDTYYKDYVITNDKKTLTEKTNEREEGRPKIWIENK